MNTKGYSQMMEQIDNVMYDDELRKFAVALLCKTPDYFTKVPASSTGKYHSKGDQGEGGLVRHSISVDKVMNHLLILHCGKFSDREINLLHIAALFHDCQKMGTQEDYEKECRTKFLHPVYASQFIMEEGVKFGLPYEDIKFICDAVITHMGQWCTSTHEPGNLPRPETEAQQLIHLADFIASRSDINVDIPEVEDIPLAEVVD